MKEGSLNQTPLANRLHIAIFGRRNAGKSTLMNAITGQATALVSEVAGTTTDPVRKTMELHPLGPCVFIDTAGLDDDGELGRLRVEKTKKAAEGTDIAIMVFRQEPTREESEWVEELKRRGIPTLVVVNKHETDSDAHGLARRLANRFSVPSIAVNALSGEGVEDIKPLLARILPEDAAKNSITGHLVTAGDVVMLVMPQDIQAPKGRLILPQVQTIRDLLDNGCVVVSTSTDKIGATLNSLKAPPALIITDSQEFGTVYAARPPQSKLTSFSVLMAGYKGDIEELVRGAEALDRLCENDKVLIAEACTHAPLSEDIGRVKIPRMLRKKYGDGLKIEIVSGNDFPSELSDYALIIHCGGCMFNRRYLLARIEKARSAGVAITNYGVALAKMTGILDKIEAY